MTTFRYKIEKEARGPSISISYINQSVIYSDIKIS